MKVGPFAPPFVTITTIYICSTRDCVDSLAGVRPSQLLRNSDRQMAVNVRPLLEVAVGVLSVSLILGC